VLKIKKVKNNRLSEMGFIKGAIFRIVKRVSGMVQLRLMSSKALDVVVREETEKDIDYVAIQDKD
jgi:Fe2+ transport system protein FeoA